VVVLPDPEDHGDGDRRTHNETGHPEEDRMSIEKTNMELMQTLDDAWNNQDWDTFEKRHTSSRTATGRARSPGSTAP